MEQIIHALTLRKYTKYNILNKIYEEDIVNKILHVAQNVKLNDDNDDDDDDERFSIANLQIFFKVLWC